MAESKTESKELMVSGSENHPFTVMASRCGLDAKELYTTLAATAMKPAKDGRPPSREELTALAIVANKHSLDPFKKEIYAYPDSRRGGIVAVVGIDGWSAIVNRHPQYDGCEFEEENDERGNPVAIRCTMHVKGRSHPVRLAEYLSECKRNTDPWNQMPRRMLRHKAFKEAARLAFSLSGIHDDDEAQDIIEGRAVIRVENAANRTQALSAAMPPPPVAIDAEAEVVGAAEA